MRSSTILLGLAILASAPCAEAKPRARRVAMDRTVRASTAPVSERTSPPTTTARLEAAPVPGVIVDAPPPAPTASTVPARRWGLFAGGMTLLLMGYGTDIGLSYGLSVERAGLSFLPVFGPLAQMGQSWALVAPSSTGNPAVDGPANQRIDAVNAASQKIAYAVLSLDFAMQVAGLTMAIVGALPPRRPPGERAPNRAVALSPTGGLGRAGLAITF